MTQRAQEIKDAVKTLYQDDKCAELGWEMDKPTVIATLRKLKSHFDDWGGDEPSCCVLYEIREIIEELETL